MRVRALDVNGDWEFGKGQNDYKTDNDAVAQSIKTRLSSFLGDCFFNKEAGIDWFNLLGSKNKIGLNLAVTATILNTEGVTGLLELSLNIDADRQITVSYKVQTIFSQLSASFQYDVGNLT